MKISYCTRLAFDKQFTDNVICFLCQRLHLKLFLKFFSFKKFTLSLLQTHSKISFFQPISCCWVFFVPAENIRKPDIFRRFRKRPVTWNSYKLPTFILITCDALHILVPFAQFKKRKNTWRIVTFSKVEDFSL